MHAWTGSVDAAFEWLDRAIAQNEDGIKSQFLVPLYASLHANPRWVAFRERAGSSGAELAAIEFEVILPD